MTQMISVPTRGNATHVADLLGVSAQRIAQLGRRREVCADADGNYNVQEVARLIGREVTTLGIERYTRRVAFKSRIASNERGRATSDKANRWYDRATHIPRDLDINALPPRAYLYGTYLQRGQVTLLSASGGVGKSAWSLSVGIDLACGADHLGAGAFKKRKVLVYNGEDDTEEMMRRAGAFMLHHGFSADMRLSVEQNLTVVSGADGPLRFADYKDGKVVILQEAVTMFKKMVRERDVEVVVLDPLIGLHTIPENANSEMNHLIVEIKNVATECNVALLLAHHDKKNVSNKSVADASQDDARGAGTITTPTRTVLSLKRLSKSDLKRLRIPAEDASRVVAISKGAKSNYSPRESGSRLFYMHSVQAQNGDDEFAADNTVALGVYSSNAGPLLSDEQCDKVLDAIRDGVFRSDSQANRPVVELIAGIADLSIDAEVKKRISGLLSEWEAAGWIKREKGRVPGVRREVPVYRVGPNRPAREDAFEAVEDED